MHRARWPLRKLLPGNGWKTAGDGDGSQPLLPLPCRCLSPLGTGGVPDPLLYCWRKEQALQARPDLRLWDFCPREGPLLLPGPSTWHPVPWTGSLWFGGDPGPSESRHTPAVAVLGYRHMRGTLLPLCCMWEGRVLHPCCFRWKILSSQQFWGWASRRDLTEVATESHCAEITLVLIGAVKCFAQTSSASSQSFSPSC